MSAQDSSARGGERLNPEQLAAATHLTGPLLINAGAGSGKTHTLTQRLVNAVVPGRVPGWEPAGVDQLLAITFTDKAAGEIAERVRLALRAAGMVDAARSLDAAWLSTVHGFCSRLLRRHALDAGIDPMFRVADTVEAWRLKQGAFADAATAQAASSAEARRLLGEYGYDCVSAAVEKLARDLDTAGLGPKALSLEGARDPREVWRDAAAFADAALVQWSACGSATKTAAAQCDACEEAAGVLGRLDAEEMGPEMLAAEVWRVLDMLPGPRPLKGLEELAEWTSATRARLLAEAACAAAAAGAEALRALTVAYSARYAELKERAGVLDFDDLQLRALSLLEGREDLAARYRSAFRLVMVDEFQDTDALQLRLVRTVSDGDLCTVGDERQSIYGFRGADVCVYREHVAVMAAGGARQVELTENYRSHPEVLAFVNAVFAAPLLFGDGLLALKAERTEPDPPAVPGDAPRVEVVMVDKRGNASAVAEEAEKVAERFAALRDAGVAPSAMAVLLRAYTHAETFAAALRARGLPVLVVGGSRFFLLPETAMLRALCRVLANPRDDEALGVLLASPLAGLSDDALWLLRNGRDGGRRHGALADALADAAISLSEPDAEAVAIFGAVLDRARERIGRVRLPEILLRAVEEAGLDLRLLARQDAGRQAYANVLKFARTAEAFEAQGGAGPAAFAAYLDAKEDSGDHESPATLADDGSPAVRLMSIHAAKGLEFDVIAVPLLGDSMRGDRDPVRSWLTGDRLEVALALPSEWCARASSKTNHTPRFRQLDDAERTEAEEEVKRLFYVACTRAREKLLLVGAGNLATEATQRSMLAWLRRAMDDLEASGAPPRWTREEVPVADDGDTDEVAQAAAERPEPAQPRTERFAAAIPAEAAPEPPTAPDRLSYSDIGLYRRCHLRFLAEKVLRIGALELGEQPDARAFGSAVHAVLQLAAPDVAPSAERMGAVARFHRLDAAGTARLTEVVRAYLASPTAAEVASHAEVGKEVAFAVPAGGPAGFLLRGRIDVYARTGEDALIVDYKTGVSGDERDLESRYRLQASCYALVALCDGRERVRVVFARPEVTAAGGAVQTVEFVFSAADAEGIERELASEHAQMAEGRYEHLPSWREEICGDCPAPGGVCPLTPLRSAA